MDAAEPVQIYAVNNPLVAELIRNTLVAEGIDCELGGESQGGFAGVLDEIQIMTKAADAERALAIIKELDHHTEEAEDEGPEDDGAEEEGPVESA
jgi:hypothetical protein